MIYCFLKGYIDQMSKYVESQVQSEFLQSKKDLLDHDFIGKAPHMRTKNPEFFFLLEVVIILFCAFSIYKWFSYFNFLIDYAPNFMENKWDISDIPYDQVERIEIVRQSWLDWYTYFYRNGIHNADEQANFYMHLGNLSRPLIIDTINYIIIPMSIGYIVWFCIKYYDYVIAASWGWFIMMYSFMTKKVECTLAKKWYIQFVTGWKKCSPSFSKYLRDWYVRFIQRPLRQEQLNYMRAYDEIKFFKDRKDVSVILDGIRNAIENILKFIMDFFKKIYDLIYGFFASLGALFLKLYYGILSLFGYNYPSETNTGENCECEAEAKVENSVPASPQSPQSPQSPPASNNKEPEPGSSQTPDNTASTCKDSLFVDLMIVVILLYPFRSYLPIDAAMQSVVYPTQAFLQRSLNVSPETSRSIFYLSLAVILFLLNGIYV